MLGLRLDPARLDEPLSPEQLSKARPSPGDPRSAHALKIAREGWTVRDMLAHGVIDYHPVIVGPAIEAADHMQEWFEADAVDGFWVSPDIYEDGSTPSSMAWCRSSRIAGCSTGTMTAPPCAIIWALPPNMGSTRASPGDEAPPICTPQPASVSAGPDEPHVRRR